MVRGGSAHIGYMRIILTYIFILMRIIVNNAPVVMWRRDRFRG